jgi:hypothetical protein
LLADPKQQVFTILEYLASAGRGAALVRNFDLEVLALVGDPSLRAGVVATARRNRDLDGPLVFSDGQFVGGKVGPAHVAIVAMDNTLPIGPQMTTRIEKGCALLARIVSLSEPAAQPPPASGSGGTGAPAEVLSSHRRSPRSSGRKPGN